jgi:hypothetical protein
MTKKTADKPATKISEHEAKPPSLAEYAGAISRWCDLHAAAPDAEKGYKQAIEFQRFNQYLAALAEENYRIANLKF